MNQHFRDGFEKLADVVAGTAIVIGLGYAFVTVLPLVRPLARSIAACPIHLTTTDAAGYTVTDRCLHLGIGQ